MNGIGFALSSTDLLRVLQRFYPSLAPVKATTAAIPAGPEHPEDANSPLEADSTATSGTTAVPVMASFAGRFRYGEYFLGTGLRRNLH